MLQGRYIPVFLEKWDAVTFPLYLLCRECSNKLNPLGHLSNIGIVVIYPDISFVDNRDGDEINPILLKFPDTEDVPALSGSAGKYHHGCASGTLLPCTPLVMVHIYSYTFYAILWMEGGTIQGKGLNKCLLRQVTVFY